MARPALSVLTPTWNRAHTLHRVYDSLQQQTARDFEWVVVDDGSTDETPALLARWQAAADFPITWYRCDNNRGQTPALNIGRGLVAGDYAMRLDSDDELFDDAVETVLHWRQHTGVDVLPGVCGLAFRCVDEEGRLVGGSTAGDGLPDMVVKATNRDARYLYGMTSDFVRVMKTDIFRECEFGELTHCENLPPVIYWNRLSDRYQTLFVDRPIRRYYRRDGVARLSDRPSRAVKWPRGNYLRALSILNEEIAYLRHSPRTFLNAARKISRLGLHVGRPPGRQIRDLDNGPARLLWALGLPGGVIGYIRDCLSPGGGGGKSRPRHIGLGSGGPTEESDAAYASRTLWAALPAAADRNPEL